MKRKHNPMLSLAALLLLATILVWICAGCGSEQVPAEETPARFICKNAEIDFSDLRIYIITDTETGQQYIAAQNIRSGGGVGMTQLLPAEEVQHGTE